MTAFVLRLHSQLFAAPLVKETWHLRMDWHAASVMWNGSWALLAVLVEIVHKLFMKTCIHLGIAGKLLSLGWSVNLSYSLTWNWWSFWDLHISLKLWYCFFQTMSSKPPSTLSIFTWMSFPIKEVTSWPLNSSSSHLCSYPFQVQMQLSRLLKYVWPGAAVPLPSFWDASSSPHHHFHTLCFYHGPNSPHTVLAWEAAVFVSEQRLGHLYSLVQTAKWWLFLEQSLVQ